jgi:hypothetical protein
MSAVLALVAGLAAAAPIQPTAQNTDLREQLEADPARVLPAGGMVVGTAEFRSFLRLGLSAPAPAYHSGLQLDVLAEAHPHERLVANLRATYVNPSFSNGMTTPVALQLWPALSVELAQPGQARVRVGDLSLLTQGAGLYLQQQEALGTSFESQLGPVHTRLLWAGTNLFNLDGDWRSLSVDLWDGTIGVTAGHTASIVRSPSTGHLTVFSTPELTPWLRSLAELGRWAGTWSALAGMELHTATPGPLEGGLKLQGRHYAPGLGASGALGLVPIYTDHDNVRQEQYDFVRLDNLLALGDGVTLAAGRGWGRWNPWRGLFLRGDLELVRAWWAAPVHTLLAPASASWGTIQPPLLRFWRTDLGVCIEPPDNICAVVSWGNRALTADAFAQVPEPSSDTIIAPVTTLGFEFFGRF